MIIIELFIKTYQLVKDNLILVQPLLLFLMLIAMVLAPVSMGGFNPAVLIVVVGLYCAFSAGWYSMFHKSIKLSGKDLSVEEKAANTITILKEFFPGVGKYFPKILIGFIMYIVLFFLVLTVGDFIGAKLIGGLSISDEALIKLFKTAAPVEIMTKLSTVDKIKVIQLVLLNISILIIFTHLAMFWPQAVISEDKNPIRAYLESLKAVLKRPFTTLVIFAANWGSILGVTVIGMINPAGFFIQILLLMLLTLTIVYFTMMTFLYFEKYRKNNSISWTNSFR